MDSDAEIIRRIRLGDETEFESLFRSSYASLVRYAKSIIKDHDSAEEIVQDLFVRIWQERSKLKIESSLNGYLYRAVHNKCLHKIDHQRVVNRYEQEMIKTDKGESATPADIIQYSELIDKIADIIERLPERCGKIFLMNRFDGLKYAEIADKLSISIKTVEADMGKALKEFRKELNR
jgi:RNA polymerase sigma-70 factor (ECF subfamily)